MVDGRRAGSFAERVKRGFAAGDILAGRYVVEGLLGAGGMGAVYRARGPLAGERFSMADITAFVGLAYADFAKIDIPSQFSNLLSWRQRVAARPSAAHA